MAVKRVVALAGGVGGAKLALGLSKVLPPEQLTIVVNVADDFELHGLHISPDLDTMMYTLSGVVNPTMGWGVDGDTTQMLDMMHRYGEDPWFRLGDRDVATHLLRSHWLREGERLTVVMQRLTQSLGIHHAILPVTDDRVRTRVNTLEHGWLDFQEYFVRHRWQPTVTALNYDGADCATISEEVRTAITDADQVVLCPSNPLLSIGPMLAVNGFETLLVDKLCIAVTPIIAGQAVKGPAAKMMAELDMSVTPLSVARIYEPFLDGFVMDEQDVATVLMKNFDCEVLITDTIMKSEQDKIYLAEVILKWAKGLPLERVGHRPG